MPFTELEQQRQLLTLRFFSKMLTDQEKQIIEYGKSQGKTKEESVAALAKFRSSQIQPRIEERGVLADIPSDVVETAKSVKDVIVRRGEREAEILEARNKGQGFFSSVFQSATNLASTIPEIFGSVIIGAGKLFTSEKTEEKIKGSLGSVVQKVAERPEVKQFIQNYKDIEKEDPEMARNIIATAEGGAFLLEFLGLGKAKQLVEGGVKTGVKTSIDVAKATAGA